MTWAVAEVTVDVHDDDLEGFTESWPDHVYRLDQSPWGLYWNQVVITDPTWITWYLMQHERS